MAEETAALAEEHITQRLKVSHAVRAAFIPVVVTTANLHAATYHIRDVDLDTGTLARDKVSFGPGVSPESLQWVLVHYDVGESLVPNAIPDEYHGVDAGSLQQYKLRSVFVVNASDLLHFFSRLHIG